MDIDTFVTVSSSIFTGFFAFVLGLICTFHTKVHSSLGDRIGLLPEWYDGCEVLVEAMVEAMVFILVLLFVQMNVVPSGDWKLLPRMNQTCGGL